MVVVIEGENMDKKSRFFEKTLPEGYVESYVVDASNKKLGILFTSITFGVNTLVALLIFFLYTWPRKDLIKVDFIWLKIIIAVLTYLVYVSLHELTHGLVYKLFTRQKVIIGFRPPAAYCGTPDIYTYKVTSLFSLFAPLVVFTAIYLTAFFLVDDVLIKTLLLYLLTLHLTGCIGDIYGIGLYLFKFREVSILRRDFGAKQIYYTMPNKE